MKFLVELRGLFERCIKIHLIGYFVPLLFVIVIVIVIRIRLRRLLVFLAVVIGLRIVVRGPFGLDLTGPWTEKLFKKKYLILLI